MLYPLLEISKDDLHPVATYGYCSKKEITQQSDMLLCKYKREHDEGYFKKRNQLFTHDLYEYMIQDGEFDILVFNLKKKKVDLEKFYAGQYSKFSVATKNTIYKYYSTTKLGAVFIDMHLNPTNYHELFADHFNADLEFVESAHETLSPPDKEKENLK
jgi:hypothetical protein